MKLSLVAAISFAALAATTVPGVAGAQEGPPAPVATRETTAQASGPRWWMVESGIALFGFAYVPAVVVGATSGLNADRALWVPVVGPWLDLSQRPGCKPTGACSSEDSAKVMVIIDGVVQAIGGLTILGGLLTHETRTAQRSASRPTLRITPSQMGNGGYGVLALGTF